MRKLFRRLIVTAPVGERIHEASHSPSYGLLIKTITSDVVNVDHLVQALASGRR